MSSKEQYLDLPGGRVLAFRCAGNPSSSIIVISFHSIFGVGQASEKRLIRSIKAKDAHYISPTLPGWGKSSPRPKDVAFHVNLANDVTALINHLHPNKPDLEIYTSGTSYGTAPAQMLYGAPFELFPYGRNIKGCLLLCPFSPFIHHKDHGKNMPLRDYVSIGPITRYIPFKLLPRLMSLVLSTKTKNVATAETFTRSMMFDNMTPEERTQFVTWREMYGVEEGELERGFAENIVASVKETWDGFYEVSDVLYSDWGFRPDALDEDHNKRPILIFSATGDTLIPDGMAAWLGTVYKNSYTKLLKDGGHISGLFIFDEIWKELFDLADDQQQRI